MYSTDSVLCIVKERNQLSAASAHRAHDREAGGHAAAGRGRWHSGAKVNRKSFFFTNLYLFIFQGWHRGNKRYFHG